MNRFSGNIREKIERLIYQFRISTDGYIPIGDGGFWEYRCPPTKSLHMAAALFDQMQGETIVEIGTGIHGEMSGNSMLVWPQKTKARRIIAVDLEQKRLDEVKAVTRQYSNVELVLADGIEYLSRFKGKIDLLYLDFWKPDPENAIPGSGRADAYRDAFKAAKDKMTGKAIILIDDTDHVHPWKHTHIVPFARANGYSVLYTGRQTLLMRQPS